MHRTVEVILILVAFSSTEASAADTFTYLAWIHDETVSIQQPASGTSGAVLHAQDATFEAEFCEQTSEYACVFSPIFAFAIPKHFDGSVKAWAVNDVIFEVADAGLSVSILGTTISDVTLIRTAAQATLLGKETSAPTFSLYSAQHGLIAFRIPKSLEVYWLVGAKGFGVVANATEP